MTRPLLGRLLVVFLLPSFVGCSLSMSAEEVARIERVVETTQLVVTLVVAFVVVVVAVSAIGQLAISRIRLVVFVTYQRDAEETANDIVRLLNRDGIQALLVSFQPRNHDDVLQMVRANLAKSHLLVTVPGSDRSFVDAEILAASVLKKPVIFIKRSDATTLPDTAFAGYPVFDFTRLKAHDGIPLGRFCRYVGNHWTDAFRNVLRAIVDSYWGYLSIVSASVFASYVIFGLLTRIFFLYSWSVGMAVRAAVDLFPTIIFALIVSVMFTLSFVFKFRAIQVAKQTMISGHLTFEILRQGLGSLAGDNAILDCLEKEPLRFRHA